MASKNKSKQSSTSSNWMEWTDPQAIELKNRLMQKVGGDQFGESNDYLKGIMGAEINPYFEKYASTIRDESRLNTAGDLATQRSQYRMRPTASAQFAGDEAVSRNNLTRDNALYQALMQATDSQASRGLQAANMLAQNNAGNTQQMAALLEMLGIEQGVATSKSRSSSFDIGKVLGTVAAGAAGFMVGGPAGAAMTAMAAQNK